MSAFGVSTDDVMKDLKVFQRRTARYAFSRLYDETNPTPHFLVADEVGLGKTLVARGVIAQSIEHLHKLNDDQINIVYICSNSAIAQQNLRKLNVVGDEAITHADRLTLLTNEMQQIEKKKINLIAITPGTSFKLDGGGGT
ncbi:MAG: DEAD/DEAH box helicase, partial [Thermomicrobiales bacterium]